MPPKKIVPKKKEAAGSTAAAKSTGAAAKGSAKSAAKGAAKSTAKGTPVDEKEQVDERLDGLLDELFVLYDRDEDGQIERVEMLEGEEKRLGGGLDFGPKERKAAVAWFKDAGAEGSVMDGLFLSKEKWMTAMRKVVEEGAVADQQKPSDWVAEKYEKLWPKAKVALVDTAGASGDGAPVPLVPPVYPLTIAFQELQERLAEAKAFKKQALVLTGGKEEVETYMNYRMYNLVDVKMYVSKVFGLKNMSLEDAQYDANSNLKKAMNSSGFCKPLHVRMSNSAPDWSRICCDGFPADLFDGELWSIEHAHKLGFIDDGHKDSLKLEDEKKWKEFQVVLTSTFDQESASEFLADKIPHYDKLAILVIDPKSFG